jgi:hypothetical protein
VFARSRFEICDSYLPDDGKAFVLRPAIQAERIRSAKYILWPRQSPASDVVQFELDLGFW